MNNSFESLEGWYSSQCNGTWEHEWGIDITTIDNPGWRVRIDLRETNLSGRDFEGVDIDRTSENWLRCNVTGEKFEGVGGVCNLSEILEIFLGWAARAGRE